MVLLVQYDSICFGYVCIRNPCSFRVADYRGQSIRLMAEPAQPMPLSSATETSNKHKEDVTSDPERVSKRERVAVLARRLRSRVSTFVHDLRTHEEEDVAMEVEEIPANEILQSGNVSGHISSTAPADQSVDKINQSEEAVHTNLSGSRVEETLSDEILPSDRVTEQIATSSSSEEIIVNSPRQSKAAEHVDLSGTWAPIVTSTFKNEYDSYLENCGESFMLRKVFVNGIVYQREVIRQLDEGINLEIIATNPAGNWNRTLVTSDGLQPMNITLTDPDGDKVQIEAWWEDNGTKHKSLFQGKPRVQGGVFETVRYLESDDVLVCESSFLPSPSSSSKFKYGNVLWRFKRSK